jgi:hypothetical protein
MCTRRHLRHPGLLAIVWLLGFFTTAALADTVARTTSVKANAKAEHGGAEKVLASGAELAQDEVVKTDRSGTVHLKFLDETQLMVGPASTIKLDKFVFNPNRRAREFVLSAVRGAFRFTSGLSDRNAYQVETPVATIGVRGTQFALGLERARAIIVVTQGSVRACTRAAAPRCATAGAGNTIVVEPPRISVRRTLGVVPPLLRTVLTLPNQRQPSRNAGGSAPSFGPNTAGPNGVLAPGLLEQGPRLPSQGISPTGTPLPQAPPTSPGAPTLR